MKKFFTLFALFAAACFPAAEKDIPNRTWDKLSYDGKVLNAGELCRPMTAQAIARQADRQLTLCMIGDSVTWAGDCDYFRKELLLLPDLTFAGTHTAVLGYSHAGEGGNSSYRVLKRINNKKSVPDASYYHLMIGVNDASAAKKDSQSEKVANGAVERIVKIVNSLLQRPATKKVFLGAILPSPFDKMGNSTVRERTGSVINKKLRENFRKYFPEGNVVWIEYEKPLRADLANWKSRKNLIGAHPTKQGYKWIAGIAAPVMKKHMTAEKLPGKGRIGVEVVNFYDENKKETTPLIPGWYTLSMELEKSGKVEFTLYSVTDKVKAQFKKSYTLQGEAGKRVQLNFMTGYQNYGYTLAPFRIEFKSNSGKKIMVEKTRPLKKASRYGVGSFVDTVSPIAPGERLVREP